MTTSAIRRANTLMTIIITIQAVMLVGIVYASWHLHGQINAVNRFIYCTLDRSERTLPTIDYYRQHPDELANQLRLVREQKAQFDAPDEPCTP